MTPQQMQALISQSFTLQPLSRAEKVTLAEQLSAGLPDASEISVLRSQLFRQAEAAINARNMHEILRWLEDMMRLLERFDDEDAASEVGDVQGPVGIEPSTGLEWRCAMQEHGGGHLVV